MLPEILTQDIDFHPKYGAFVHCKGCLRDVIISAQRTVRMDASRTEYIHVHTSEEPCTGHRHMMVFTKGH